MTDAPKIPEATGAAVHRAMGRVRTKHKAVHAHNRRRTTEAYASDHVPSALPEGESAAAASAEGTA